MEPELISQSTVGAFAGIWGLLWILAIIIFIAAAWKIFTKAGRPGWASLIPIYNTYIYFKIAGMSGWWLLSFLFPPVLFIAAIILSVNLAHVFGKSTAWGVLLLLIFSPIGLLMLGFGSAQYQGTMTAPTPAPSATPTTPQA